MHHGPEGLERHFIRGRVGRQPGQITGDGELVVHETELSELLHLQVARPFDDLVVHLDGPIGPDEEFFDRKERELLGHGVYGLMDEVRSRTVMEFHVASLAL